MVSTSTEYKRRREKIISYLGGCCVRCGSTKDLHVDHIFHLEKSFSVGRKWSLSWERLEPELKKCQLLCKEHHLEKSKAEGSLAKGWTTQPQPPKHGTVWCYSKYKCRCALCRKAKSEAGRKERSNKTKGS